jgi:ribonuclease T
MNNSCELPPDSPDRHPMAQRFRGFLPVVIDVETAGLDPQHHALLEIGAVFVDFDAQGLLIPTDSCYLPVQPFPGSLADPRAMAIHGIDLHQRLIHGLAEQEALQTLYRRVRQAMRQSQCLRAILVGHNAHFDLAVLRAANTRCAIKRNPFHAFSCLDTVSLSAAAYGETVLARAAQVAGLEVDNEHLHRALYDARLTAALFCTIINACRPLFRGRIP